ncbi:mitochondrial carrier [Jaminaea rosea]|uniref:Mitochondrial carrier n=1 Tax=Jaminaea rosea TaxID=1569628 RepID=A0A316UT69_9BASI|nr:mitochondrial carrier [Jaminaea rosea]PWN28496.1 mitochondrial carrier [Jaminaea rosea]
MSKQEIDSLLWDYRTVCTAGTASLVSTMASFPFDSLKSRLQVKYYPSIWSCARAVAREEGIGGFFRGVTIPLITISFVRTSSFSIYVNTKQALHQRGYAKDKSRLRDVALSGMAGGATSGIIISCGSAPFELVKVQRQLEYLTAVQKGLIGEAGASNTGGAAGSRRPSPPAAKYKPQSGFAAASDILRNHGGIRGFYIGFPLHLTRDTLGTMLYFGSYDSIRSMVGRYSKDGTLFGLPSPVVSFLSGSTAGIASWLLVYPVDLLKTNVQQRTLSGHPQQLTGYQLFTHLLRERPPPEGSLVSKDTLVRRFLRLYRGLGVSALRSFISHGLTWTLIESLSDRLERRTGRKMRET